MNGYYVNFIFGEEFLNRGKYLEILILLKCFNNLGDLFLYEDMYSYVNFSFGKIIDDENLNNSFKKYSLEFVLLDKFCVYENIDFRGIIKSKSVVDVFEYVNFVLGDICESSINDVFLVNDDLDIGLVKV